MGGSVAVTLREPSGQEHRMCRWTNSLPWFVNNVKLLRKDSNHLKRYLETWKFMRDDYLKHKKDGKFEQGMSDVYGPHPFLAPHDYGLVVVDMQKDIILSNQDYTGFGTTHLFGSDIEDFDLSDDEPKAVRVKEFLESGKIKGAEFYNRKSKQISRLPVPQSLDGLREQLKVNEGEVKYILDMAPFRVFEYRAHDPEQAVEMRKKIRDLGFIISDEENKLWDGWIKTGRDNGN